MFVLLAFAACQRGPVMYEKAENPRQVVGNAEKFVKQTEKQSKHYSAEDWQVAVQQFVAMSKDYVENMNYLSEEEQRRFDYARHQFMSAIDANGTEAIAAQIKEVYARAIE